MKGRQSMNLNVMLTKKMTSYYDHKKSILAIVVNVYNIGQNIKTFAERLITIWRYN